MIQKRPRWFVRVTILAVMAGGLVGAISAAPGYADEVPPPTPPDFISEPGPGWYSADGGVDGAQFPTEGSGRPRPER